MAGALGTYQWSNPTQIQGLLIPNPLGSYHWTSPSNQQSLQVLSFVLNVTSPTTQTYTDRTIHFVATSPTPAKLKIDTNPVTPFESMTYVVSDVAVVNHNAFFTLPPVDGAETLYVKGIDDQGVPLGTTAMIPITLNWGPTGTDVHSLLRLRKYFKHGQQLRWAGKNAY